MDYLIPYKKYYLATWKTRKCEWKSVKPILAGYKQISNNQLVETNNNSKISIKLKTIIIREFSHKNNN